MTDLTDLTNDEIYEIFHSKDRFKWQKAEQKFLERLHQNDSGDQDLDD